MFRLFKYSLLLLALTFFLLNSSALANRQNAYEIPIPDDIKEAKDAKSLRKYLYDKNAQHRYASVKKLGEIRSSDAIDILNEFFEKEPYIYRPIQAGVGVKSLAITAMGSIHEERVKRLLLKILSEYLKRKPTFGDTKWEDGTRFHVLNSLIDALSNWDDADIKQKLSEISDNVNVNYVLREAAQEQLLNKYMKERGIDTPAKQIDYLMGLVKNKETDWVVIYRNKSGPDALQAMRTAIAVRLLRRFDVAHVPEMEKYYNLMPEEKMEERKILRKVIDYVKAVNDSNLRPLNK